MAKSIEKVICVLVSTFILLFITTSTSLAANRTKQYYDVGLKSPVLGYYEFGITAYEKPSNEVLPIVDKSYFPKTFSTYTSEIDNTPPSALYSKKEIKKSDVVFALGELSQIGILQSYIPTFISKLESASNYLDIKVEQVKTSTIDMSAFGADAIFNSWRKMPQSKAQMVWQLDAANGKIYAEGVKQKMGTHGSVAIIDPSEDGFNTTDFTMQFKHETKGPNGEVPYKNVVNGWSNHISGALFRYTENAVGTYNTYAVLIADSSPDYAPGTGTGIPFVSVIKVESGDADFLPGNYISSLFAGWSSGVQNTSGALTDMQWYYGGKTYPVGVKMHGENHDRSFMTLLQARAIVNTTSHDFKIVCKGNNIKVYCGDILQLDVNDTYGTPYMKGTYGLFSFSSPSIYFSNFAITKDTSKSLGEAISDVAWRDNTTKFVIHATDIVPSDMKNTQSSSYAYTVTKLLNTDCYLINLGNGINNGTLNKLIQDISSAGGDIRGVCYNNTPIVGAMDSSSDWILQKMQTLETTSDWILVNTEVAWDTNYNDSERDLPLNYGLSSYDTKLSTMWLRPFTNLYTDAKIIAEKWRFKHDNLYFDNSLTQESYHNIWLDSPRTSFPYTGQYRINYKRKDNPLEPNVDSKNIFDNYRYWSKDYDLKIQK